MIPTKEEFAQAYATYPDTMTEGIEEFVLSKRIEHLVYEVPFGARVLDIGCNSGEVMKLLQEKRMCHVQGIDLSEVAIAKAKEKALDVQVGDAEHLSFSDHSFDVVLLLEALMHMHDPLKALQEIKRVLKPSGILLGSTPHRNLEKYVWEEKAPHHPYYETKELGELLDQVFKFSHLWELKGAQFSVQFANTFMAAAPAEILFKCGSTGEDHKWWQLMRQKKTLRVWFGATQFEGDVYYRMRGFADKMREQGVEAAYENFDYKNTDEQRMWQNRCRNGIVLSQLDAILKVADLSVWQIVCHPDALAFLRCAKDVIGKPMVTEIDDWLLDVPQYNIASGPFKTNSPNEWYALQQLKLSDAIVTSTVFLSEKIASVPDLQGKRVYVIPNSIDFAIWDHLKEIPFKKKEGIVRIGYSGCGNHGGDLYMIKPALLAILDNFPNVEFVYAVPMKDPHAPHQDFHITHERARCINEWYTMEQFPQMLKNWDLDIGIAPLVDNNFNRAKSNLRWLEYSALRLPCVASAVEPFRRTMLAGQDGLLCRGSKEWYEALKHLIVNSQDRARLGDHAYARVKRNFNMDQVALRYIQVLEEIKRECKPALRRDREIVQRSQ